MLRRRTYPKNGAALCASLRSRNPFGHCTRATLCGNCQTKSGDHTWYEPAQSTCTSTLHKSHCIRKFTGKNATPQKRDTHFVRACAVDMHLEILQKPLYTEIYCKTAAPQKRDTHFVRACTVEMQLEISQEPLYTEIYR